MSQLLTVAEVVAAQARLQPDKIGARDSRRALSFRQWHERASRLANALLALGLQKGDRVALLAYNCVEWMEMYVALARVGLVAVPINFRLVGPEIQYIAQDCEARALIVQDALLERVETVRDQLDIPAQRFIHFGAATAPAGWTSYESIIEQASAAEPGVVVQPEDTCALMYTSGTTGRPKGAIRNHGGNALISLIAALDLGFAHDDTALLVMPMCHANSLYFCVHLHATAAQPAWSTTARASIPRHLLRTLAEEEVTFTSLVPTHYIMMLGAARGREAPVRRQPRAQADDLVGARAPRDQARDHGATSANSQLFELYGSTEAGWVTLLRPTSSSRSSVRSGREWTGSGAIKLLDADGHEVPDGEVGELYSRTPYVFDGYWKNPDKTAEAFHGAWCSVGDMARRDERRLLSTWSTARAT